ncbi:MAG: hypothetical protein ACTS5I_02720 [Rhodanobacter sp.]
MPDWYAVVKAAHYYGIAPWELAARPAVWTHWAVTADTAEQQAESELMAASFKKKK